MLESRVVFKGRKEWHKENVVLDLVKEKDTLKVLCELTGLPIQMVKVMYEGDNRLYAENTFMTGFHHYLADEYLIVTDDKKSKEQALYWFHKAVQSLYFRIMSSFGFTPEGNWKVSSYYKTDEKQVNEIGITLERADETYIQPQIKHKRFNL